MQEPAVPDDEAYRLQTLRSLSLLDSSAEERFDRLTRLAKRLFNVPIALVSLVDENRQWFKSCVGLDVAETPRNVSFCGHAILGDEIFYIPNAIEDPRFADNPLVTGPPDIRFYAGCPLRAPNGQKLGTLCIIDREPRRLDDDEMADLRDLARMAEDEIAAITFATIDELTKISNRRGFEELARKSLALCERMACKTLLLFFDLNRFKQINDQYGHSAGDQALIDFAQLLVKVFRASDVVARISGDEFAVLATGVDATQQQELQARFEREVIHFNNTSGRPYQLAFSVGYVHTSVDSNTLLADLMHEADKKMYAHKAAVR